jgi:hypothetical protein
MKASEFLRRYEAKHDKKQQSEEDTSGHKNHSLQAHARERAEHPDHMHAGTAFDWEDLELYQKELERLDREGPKSSNSGAQNKRP